MAADAALVGKWLHGWTAAREKPSPAAIAGGWRVDVNDPDQTARYVFPHADDNLHALHRAAVDADQDLRAARNGRTAALVTVED